MKRSLATLLLLIAALTGGRAQDIIRWGEGPRDWAGFTISAPTDSVSSFGSFTLLKEKKTVRTPGITYRYMSVTGALIPQQSKVRPDAMTDASLLSIRQDLDILEYYARLFRDELLFTKDKDRTLEKAYITRFHEAQDKARATGDHSPYDLSPDTFDITRVPFDQDQRFYCVALGLFTNIPLGDQGRLLHPTAGVSAAISFGRRRGSFRAEIDYGLSLYRHRPYDFLDKPVPYIGVFAQYNRELIQTGRLRLLLSGGPGYTTRAFDHLDYRQYVGGPAFTEGLSTDLHLHRNVSFSNSRPEQSDTFLQLKLSFCQTFNLAQQLIIPSVNISAGIYFQGRSIKTAAQ